MKVDFQEWFDFNLIWHAKENEILTWQKSLTITYPTHITLYKSNFRKGSFVMSQNVIIRLKMDFSNMADNCYSDHVLTWQVSRQKKQATARVHWPLNREGVSLFTTRSDGLERSESNYFCTVINKILVKENIFYIMANLGFTSTRLCSIRLSVNTHNWCPSFLKRHVNLI